jgi:hypothetical protein
MTQVWNQRQQIIQYMIDHKEMTKADGWSFGCTKVDSRISELRRTQPLNIDGGQYIISDRWEKNLNGGRHKVYFLEEITEAVN